ncbi:UNVERIFIED_ORG: hypothetical protein GGD59_006581 [Rhizobium esperanzae]
MQKKHTRLGYRVRWDMEDECTIDVPGAGYVFQILITKVWLDRFVYFLEKTTFEPNGDETDRTVTIGHEPTLSKAKKAAMTAFRRHYNATLEPVT